MTCRVLLVDDHQMMREGLRAQLEQQDDIEVVGEAEDGRAATSLADELDPDIVVMDTVMPDMNGIEATRQIKAAHPAMKIIALSMHADKRYVMEMLRAGASAYLLKDAATEELLQAIRAVQSGTSFLSPEIASKVINEMVERSASPTRSAYTSLTNREREVLQLLAEGHTSRRIGERLGVAVRTVETHRREIMRKLDLHSVAELTKYAIREGLTSLE